MRRALNMDDVRRAGDLARRGWALTDIARETGRGLSTIKRWKVAYPDAFEPHAPGSLEHRRSVLLGALEATLADGRPDHATRVRAAEDLSKLDPSAGSKGPGLVRVNLSGPKRCPKCNADLVSAADATVVREGDAS